VAWGSHFRCSLYMCLKNPLGPFVGGTVVVVVVVVTMSVNRDLVGGGEKFVDEIHVGDVVLLIGNDTEKLAKLVGFGVLELLAQRAEDVLDLWERDFAGALLVEDLQAFNVILLDSRGRGVGLDGGENGEEIGEGDALDAEGVGATGCEDRGVGHVAAQSAEDVAQIESIDISAFVGLVEDDESILSFGFRHFEWF